MPFRFVTIKWLLGILLGVVVWTALTWFVFAEFGIGGLLVMSGLMAFVVLYLAVEILLRLVHRKKTAEMDYEQVQALIGFYTALQPKMPLFQMRRFALAPDTAALYMHLIRLHQPETIVEFGSGTSTVISGYMIQRNGKGRVIALDDDKHWAQETRNMLETHGLGENIKVRHAPLVPVEVEGQTRNWYDPKALEDIDKIDMLLVDGPKDSFDKGTRYPALILLADRLSEEAVVIADDASRPKWRKMVYSWADKNGFKVEAPYPNDHGTLILKRQGKD